MHDHPHVEILKFWPLFLNLLDGDWPADVVTDFPEAKLDDPTWPVLEYHFRSVQHLEFDEWWEHCHPYFEEAGTPVHRIRSAEDLSTYRDEEAEADNDQVTVTINLWHTRTEIDDALCSILDELRPAKAGNPNRGWDTVEGYHIYTNVDGKTLKDILDVLKQVKAGKRNVEIQNEMNEMISSTAYYSAATISKLRKKGFTILEHLRRWGNFPKIG